MEWLGTLPELPPDRENVQSGNWVMRTKNGIQRMAFREWPVLFPHGHSAHDPELMREFMSSRSVIPIKIMTYLLSYAVSAGRAHTTQLFIEKLFDETFPCENIALEIKDISTITGYFCYHYP
jgi:hypothetical protein